LFKVPIVAAWQLDKDYLTTHFLQMQMLVDILVLKEEKEVLCQ